MNSCHDIDTELLATKNTKMKAKSGAASCIRREIYLFVLFCAFSWPTEFVLSKESPAAGPVRFEPEIAAFEKWDRQNAVPQNCILFVGSSSIRLWQTADAFPGHPVINRGFGGSTIPDVTHFADRIIFKYKPRTIVFYAGDNDIAAERSPDKVFADYEKFADLVHERIPNTRLIYLAIKPSPLRWKLWPKSQAVNDRIRELTRKSKHDLYVDVATPILGTGDEPRKELFRDDGLHMNPQGYEVWNKILAPFLTH
jgi:lysophospholipase L1-like esterase